MNVEEYRDFCIALPCTTEEFPFNNQVLVFKVGGEIFAFASIDLFERIILKCDPERAIDLREQHEAIVPGYHMNKKHRNTVIMDGTIKNNLLTELIQHSYELVVAGLPKNIKEQITSAS